MFATLQHPIIASALLSIAMAIVGCAIVGIL
jgi:hypothetical protein